MIKVFMSYGMNGRSEEEQRQSRSRLRNKVKDYFSHDTYKRYGEIWHKKHNGSVPCVTSYALSHMNPMKHVRLIDNHKATTDGGRLSYLGLAIQKMDECDAIIFDENWMDYKGCRIEHEVAESYGLKIIEV